MPSNQIKKEVEFEYNSVRQVIYAGNDNESKNRTIQNLIQGIVSSTERRVLESRDNQIRSRIANIFASKYENEPRVSEKIERAVMNCFNDADFEPKQDAIITSRIKEIE